jgi:hypothetical protein
MSDDSIYEALRPYEEIRILRKEIHWAYSALNDAQTSEEEEEIEREIGYLEDELAELEEKWVNLQMN